MEALHAEDQATIAELRRELAQARATIAELLGEADGGAGRGGEAAGAAAGRKGLRVRGARFEPRGVVVEVQPPRRKSRCGVCGCLCPRYDSSQLRICPWGVPRSG